VSGLETLECEGFKSFLYLLTIHRWAIYEEALEEQSVIQRKHAHISQRLSKVKKKVQTCRGLDDSPSW
jgi:hypothetical protein